MRCKEVREQFADGLRAPWDSAIRAHLEQCPDCRAEFDQMLELWSRLKALAVPVRERPQMRAALLAQMKWRNRMREALKAAAVIVAIASLAAGDGLLLKTESPRPQPVTATAVESLPAAAHVRGTPAAPITLVEYGDYECPGCGAAHPIVNLVLEHFGPKLRFVFRHFPLTQVHPNAEPAA